MGLDYLGGIELGGKILGSGMTERVDLPNWCQCPHGMHAKQYFYIKLQVSKCKGGPNCQSTVNHWISLIL